MLIFVEKIKRNFTALNLSTKVRAAAACGGAAAVFTTAVSTAPIYDIMRLSYRLGTEVATTGVFKLCWGNSPVQDTDFAFEFGDLVLIGAQQGTWSCAQMTLCILQLTGTNLTTANAIRIQCFFCLRGN